MKHARARYQEPWLRAWEEKVASELRAGLRILDVGSGRRPALPREQRPADCTYVGLDLSMDELLAAPTGSYDEMIASDVATFRPELAGRFDLVLSWQVLEHVRPLGQALENIRRYLVPGGRFLAHLSGKFSAFALLNQLLPHRISVWALKRFLSRDPRTVFPAHYDACWYGALVRVTAPWTEAEVIPRYRGSGYFKFWGLLEHAYLAYEDWAVNRGHHNLATHYLISARR
jgi:SAM-dependent methyltransferase